MTEQAGSANKENPYHEAEEAWVAFQAAADRIQVAANKLKKGERSIDGYDIERALARHKPDLIEKHLDGLRSHRKEHKL